MKKQIIVLGGGISGLTAAWRLLGCGEPWEVTVLEKSDRPGGWISSSIEQGNLRELGPRSCRSRGLGLETLALAKELGLESEVIFPTKQARQRFLVHGGVLRPLPQGAVGAFRHWLGWRLPWAVMREPFVPPSVSADESVYDFGMRRFGSFVTDHFFDPMVKGIYAGDIRQLSIRSCFPQIFRWERECGSVVKGLWRDFSPSSAPEEMPYREAWEAGLFSFRNGVQTLTDALAKALGHRVMTQSRVTGIRFFGEEVQVSLGNGEVLRADYLVSALPAETVADLMAVHDAKITSLLRGIPCASVGLVHLVYSNDGQRIPEGFGYLVPEREREEVLGVVFDSSLFPQQPVSPGARRFTVMVGGALSPHLVESPDRDLVELAQKAIRRHLKIRGEPLSGTVTRARDAIPQYLVGHEIRVQELLTILERKFPRLWLTGNYLTGVGVNDCVAKSGKLVEAFREKVAHEPLAACM